eukprot:CAMPEP_0194684260 /NCGR_PEP_ID=MMETSP0295-20121207/13981_1 /TAXON_ID=39354 /ORGANISM="Heterosigma akashiwo, Strain CCMP2393" /LENGTH=130 /DNA_ID=CAMNT_0039571219 /DNA_START=106 /DNA_END=498 /DNA_ORIENTATION=-
MAEVMVLTSEDNYASTGGYVTATLGSTTTNLESGCSDEYDYGQVEFYDLDDLDDYDEITIGFSGEVIELNLPIVVFVAAAALQIRCGASKGRRHVATGAGIVIFRGQHHDFGHGGVRTVSEASASDCTAC